MTHNNVIINHFILTVYSGYIRQKKIKSHAHYIENVLIQQFTLVLTCLLKGH